MKLRLNNFITLSVLLSVVSVGMFLQKSARSSRNVGFDLDYYANAAIDSSVNSYKYLLNFILMQIEVPWLMVGLVPSLIFLIIIRIVFHGYLFGNDKRDLFLSLIFFTPFLYLSSSGYRDIIISAFLASCYYFLIKKKYFWLLIFGVLSCALRDISFIIILSFIFTYKIKQKYLLLIFSPVLCFVGVYLLASVFPSVVELVSALRKSYSNAILDSNSNFLSMEFFNLSTGLELFTTGMLYHLAVILFLPFMSLLNFLIFTSTAIGIWMYSHVVNLKVLAVFLTAYSLYIFVYCVIGYSPSALLRQFCMIACSFWVVSICNVQRVE